MKITTKWLRGRGACADGTEWFTAHFPEGGGAEEVGDALLAEKQWEWAQWLARKVAETDPAAAEEIAAKIADAYVRAWALREVSWKVAEKDPKAAGRIAARIEDADVRALALREVAVKVAAKDPQKAKRIAGRIEDAGWRDWALREVARVATGK